MEPLSYLYNNLSNNTVVAGAVGLSGLAVALLIAAVADYRAWVAFGTGGTPPNIKGYLKITKFRVLRLLGNDDLKDASSLPSSGPSYIRGQLRKRMGAPPKILARTLPQRQYPEGLAPAIYQRLHALPKKYATANPEILILDASVTEGHSTDAIYSKIQSPTRARDKILGNEIAHVHPAENSLHVWLTVADAKKVLESGWGERFPLASLGMVDHGWTFLYAPRSMDDVDMIEEIIKAAIEHLTGKKVQ